MTTAQAETELARLQDDIVDRLPDHASVYDEWLRLVIAHEVKGIQVHDARLVAFMRVHGLSHILTFNTKDFKRYPGITVVAPRDVEAP